MEDKELFISYVTAVGKIARITKQAFEEYYNLPESASPMVEPPKKKKRESRIPIVNITDAEKESCQTWIKQFKDKDEETFFQATRMSIESFDLLLSKLKEKLKRYSNRKPIDPETRLAITLIYLAQGCKIKTLAWGFEIGFSTVSKIIYETCDAIWDELNGEYFSTPNSTDLETIAEEFYLKTGMPNCIGAVEAKKIRIKGSSNHRSMYFDKNSRIVALLAACDVNYVFTYADIVDLSSQHDVEALTRSSFGNKLLNGTLEIPSDAKLPGTSTKLQHYFIGNNGFPLKTHLMRPYPELNLTHAKSKFNTVLTKAWSCIENSFGILASRWRILTIKIQSSQLNIRKIVLATMVLHNFLMLHDDDKYFTPALVDHTKNRQDIPGQWRSEILPLKSYQPKASNRSSTVALQSRDFLRDFLQINAE